MNKLPTGETWEEPWSDGCFQLKMKSSGSIWAIVTCCLCLVPCGFFVVLPTANSTEIGGTGASNICFCAFNVLYSVIESSTRLISIAYCVRNPGDVCCHHPVRAASNSWNRSSCWSWRGMWVYVLCAKCLRSSKRDCQTFYGARRSFSFFFFSSRYSWGVKSSVWGTRIV